MGRRNGHVVVVEWKQFTPTPYSHSTVTDYDCMTLRPRQSRSRYRRYPTINREERITRYAVRSTYDGTQSYESLL